MIDRLGERLPRFTEEEIKLVHGSSEFYGWCADLSPSLRLILVQEGNGSDGGSPYGDASKRKADF